MTRRKPRDGWHEKECLVLLGRITCRKPPSSSYWRLNRRPLGSVMWDSWNRYLSVRHYLWERNTLYAFVRVQAQFFRLVYNRETSTQRWHTNVAFSTNAHLLKKHIIHKLSLLSSSHQIFGVYKPQHSKFWPFFITHFNTTVSAFCDWFQWIGMRPHAWRVSFPHALSKSSSVFHNVRLTAFMLNEMRISFNNLLYSFYLEFVFYSNKLQ